MRQSVIICTMYPNSEVFMRGGEWGTRPLLSEFSGSAPGKGDRTGGFQETEGHIGS